MSDNRRIDDRELELLFERYRSAPRSHVFAPLADACRKAGMIEEAIEIVEKGVSQNPGYTSGHVVRGKCYYDHGVTQESEASFERVLELDANNLVALKYLGMIRAEEDDAEAAREHFKHILALDPGNKEIKRLIETLPAAKRASQKEREEPREETNEERSQSDPTRWREIPEERFEGATISLGEAEDAMSDELATLTLADIYADQGYTSRALRIYREVLRSQPDNETVRRRIAELEGDGGVEEETAPLETTDELELEPTQPDVEAAFEEMAEEPVLSPVVDEEAPEREPPAEQPAQAAAPPRAAAAGDKNYQQFKRWLRNLSD